MNQPTQANLVDYINPDNLRENYITYNMSRRGADRLDDRSADAGAYGAPYGSIHQPPPLDNLAPSPLHLRQDPSQVQQVQQVPPQVQSPRKRRIPGPGQQPPVAATASTIVAPPPPQPHSMTADEQQQSNMAPPPKKTRTNTPWTPAEEQRLKNMRDAGNSWAEIAKTFPMRTEGSVKKHWYKDMHYAEFAEDESQALLNAIKEYETNKWKVIGQKVGKPAKACEQYAKEHFGKT